MKNASYCVSYGKERRLQQNELKSSFCYSPFLHFLEPRAHDEPGQGQDDEGAGDGADHRADAFFGDD